MDQERHAIVGYGFRMPGGIATAGEADGATGSGPGRHLGTYVGSFASPRQDVLSRSRHVIRWEPKFAVPPRTASADLEQLIGSVSRVAEFAQDAAPEHTMAAGCLGAQGTEYWLLGADQAAARRLLEAFGQGGEGGEGGHGGRGGRAGAVRFAVADLSEPAAVDFTTGLLREAACDLVMADTETAELTQAAWEVIRRLLVPGGLALIRHAGDGRVPAPAGPGWSLLAGESDGGRARAELWAAPAQFFDDGPAEPEGPRWLIAGSGPLADMWAWWMAPGASRVAMESLDAAWLWSVAAQDEMRGLRAVDFFCDESGQSGQSNACDEGDPVGERLVARFLEFLRALLAAREGADEPCRVTVVTRQAAFDVASPRSATLWGAVRALGHELGSAIDLRLADLGEPEDLTTLRWLARHDVRERELAVRSGRLLAPRLVPLPGPGEATSPDEAARRLTVTDRRPFLDPGATYLVSGGFGGLGQHLVAYLVSAGARHLTLLDRDPAGRRDAAWGRHASGIAQYFPGTDVRIDIAQADVSRRQDVDRMVKGLTRPLKGVFHLAAVLDDHHLCDVTPESVAAVFAPKAGGAWNLHQATLEQPLDHFVLLSSVASVIGSAGQSVYAAASAFLDGLAAYRRSRGLPALAFNMAALAEAGMAARQPHVLRLMRAGGMPPVSVAVAIASLDAALRGAGPDHVVCADIGRLPGDASHPDFMRTGRWMRPGIP
jgi:NAD(P)-dependent dehydrogenase (short-subunit alcohol dehydrogenase family)